MGRWSTSVAGGSGYRRYYRIIEPPKEVNNMIYVFFINEHCYGYIDTWERCKALTDKAPGAKYKKFKDKAEAGLYLKSLIKK